MRRWELGSVPGQREDGLKIALAIEGGGMRGVVSAGMVTGLEYLGLLPAFDVIYGTSAGAFNGAFFIAGQAAYGTTIYYENINNLRFVNLLRPLVGKPAVSLEFLFEQVLINEKILDWERVVNSPIPLKVVASSIRHVRPEVLDGFKTRDDLFSCLKASARIPVVAGPPVKVGEDDYLDGSLFASIPFHQALEAGCTHVLALLTRPVGQEPKGANAFDRYIVPTYLKRYNEQLKRVVTDRLRYYALDIDSLAKKTVNPDEGPYLFAVQPGSKSAPVGRLEKRRNQLIAGARDGMTAIMEAFSLDIGSYVETLAPFDASGHGISGVQSKTIADRRVKISVQV